MDRHFTGTTSKLGGVGLDVIHEEGAWPSPDRLPTDRHLPGAPGPRHRREYQWRREGEPHLFDPRRCSGCSTPPARVATTFSGSTPTPSMTRASASLTLRGLFDLKIGQRPPVPIDEVEPVSEIVKRFSTGAMSYGSISKEAHETLAIAMNRLGPNPTPVRAGGPRAFPAVAKRGFQALVDQAGRVWSVRSHQRIPGERRRHPDQDGQGAKPGEGGQLPAHKVYPWVAKTRHSTPGVA